MALILTEKVARVSQTSRKPICIAIIQVYAPTTEAEEEETGSFYTSIQENTDHIPKQDMLLIFGDWNTKLGNIAKSNVIRKCGLGVRYEEGD